MFKPITGLLSCLFSLSACTTNPAVPPNQASGQPPASPQSSATPSPQSGGPADSLSPSAQPSSTTSNPSPSPQTVLPAGLAGLRLDTGNRFLRGQGASTQFKAVLLDTAGQVLQADVPLQWQSSRPQDFSVDAQGQLRALVDSGYSDIQVRIPGTAFSATAVINVSSFSGGGTSSSLRPPNLSGLSGATLSDGKYILIRDQILTLSGSGFLPGLFSYQVLFGAIPASAISISDSGLTVRVPLGVNQAGDVPIRVVTNNLSSNTLTGTVLAENLAINNGGFF